jgi:DNA polymerase elongation subunit (family B)
MNYAKEKEMCDHCKKEIEEVEVVHGFATDVFQCPYCKERNERS